VNRVRAAPAASRSAAFIEPLAAIISDVRRFPVWRTTRPPRARVRLTPCSVHRPRASARIPLAALGFRRFALVSSRAALIAPAQRRRQVVQRSSIRISNRS
jgi:hypothetical protein